MGLAVLHSNEIQNHGIRELFMNGFLSLNRHFIKNSISIFIEDKLLWYLGFEYGIEKYA